MATPVKPDRAHRISTRFKNFDLSNPYALVSLARKGVKTKVFDDFAIEINMPERKLAALIGLSYRALSNSRDQDKSLAPVPGEHLLKLIALYEKGERVFGNVDEFNYWLQKSFWNQEQNPLDWISTPGGVDLLMGELEKLAQGYTV